MVNVPRPTPMDTSDQILPEVGGTERRAERRVDIGLACKVWHPRALRFFPGTTRELSRDGTSILLRTGVPFKPGERIRIGLPAQAGAILLRTADLVEGTVLRSETQSGHVVVAISFDRTLEA